MVFFFFVFAIAVIIGVAAWNTQRAALNNTFANAAGKLGLRNAEATGLLHSPWIYGERHGIRIDVKPFTHTRDGHRSRWTGYRLSFDQALDITVRGEHDPKRQWLTRLSNRFSSCEIDAREIFCARSSLPADSARIVSDVEYLLNAGRELRNALVVEAVEPVPSPPPLPEKAETPAIPVVEPEPTPTPVATPAPVVAQEVVAEIVEPGCAVTIPPAKSGPMNEAARSLFEAGLNHFEIGRRFDGEMRGRMMEGHGTLRRVERFRNDRYLGRGPGIAAELELLTLADARGGLQSVVVVIPLPEEDHNLSAWRERLGDAFTFCGSPSHCDAFAGRIHCSEGLLEA